LQDFPELTSLVGVKQRIKQTGPRPDLDANKIKILPADSEEIKELKKEIKKQKKGEISKVKKREKTSGLTISFEENFQPDLARIIENTILINTFHPAYKKAKNENSESYHIFFAWLGHFPSL
jgi:hypothetical protein